MLCQTVTLAKAILFYDRFEELMRTERGLDQELQALERKFEAWAQAKDVSLPSTRSEVSRKPLSTARDVTKDLPPEVATFEVHN